MSFYDELLACEAGPQGPVMFLSIACDVAQPIIQDAYSIPPVTTCPPGAEPEPPELVAARVATKIKGVPIFGGDLAPEARVELDQYVGLRYALAVAAWHERVQVCAAQSPPPPPPPPVDGAPPPVDKVKVTAASFPVGAVFVLLGLGMIVASRR